MTPARTGLLAYVIAGLGSLIAWAWSSGLNALGTAGLGFALSVFSLATLSATTRSLTRRPADARKGSAVIVTAALLKLPILTAGIYIATRYEGRPLYCFLLAVGLVYSSFVWFLASRPDL